MKTTLLVFCSRLMFLLMVFTSPVLANKKSSSYSTSGLNSEKVRFTENMGQVTDMAGKPTPHVLFTASAPGVHLFVTNKGLTYLFVKEEEEHEKNKKAGEKHQYQYNTVDLELKGAEIKKENVITSDVVFGHYDFYFPHCPDGILNVREYEKLIIKDIYPGIDWVLYNGGTSGFKYDFIVRPGGNVASIKLEYSALSAAYLDDQGHLFLKTKLGQINETAPYSYLLENKQEIKSSFQLLKKTKEGKIFKTLFGVSVDPQNILSNATLVVDPQLTWATFYGGSSAEGTKTIELDKNGNIFTAGYCTNNGSVPLLNSGTYYQGTNVSGSQMFILKFSPTGAMLWGTFYGGSGANTLTDVISIAIDTASNIFLCGSTTTTNFPLQTNSTFFQGTAGAVGDAFIIKFNNLGTRLWATYYGGNSVDNALGVCTDIAGNVFMVGNTQSTNLPLQNNGTYFQATSTLTTPGFITKFSNSGNLIWATLYDGLSPIAATIDLNNNLLVTGQGAPGAMPTLNPGGGAYFQGTGASTEAAILKFNNNGLLIWSTFLGGNSIDMGRSITADKFGNCFVAGMTGSTNFPTLNSGGYLQSTIGSTALTIGDAFITKFGTNGAMLWSTYYGGNDLEAFSSYDNLCTDTCGNVYLAFETKSSNLTTQSACDLGYRDSILDVGTVQNVFSDIYVARFSNNGVRQWATYVGGFGVDFRSPIDFFPPGHLYLTGEWNQGTQTDNYPAVSGGTNSFLDSTFNGTDDTFFARFTDAPAAKSISYGGPYCQNNTTVGVSGSGLASGGTFSASPGLSINPSTGVITPTASAPGIFTISYAFSYSACICGTPGTSPTNTVLITTTTISALPSLSVSGTMSICPGDVTNLTASGAISYTWNTGAQFPNVTLNPNVTTIYTVTGKNQAGCTSAISPTVTVNPAPSLSVTAPSTICKGQSATLVVSGAASYSWSNGPTTATNTVSPVATSVYTVTGVNTFGCAASAMVTLNVSNCVSLQDEKLFSDLKVFPNPNHGAFTLETTKEMTLILVNEIGQELKKVTLGKENQYKTELRDLSPGIYFLKDVKNKNSLGFKIVVEN